MPSEESSIERSYCGYVKKKGGYAIKIYFTGWPDRLTLLPGAIIFFVELKAHNEDLRKLQENRKSKIEALGFKVYKVDNAKQGRKLIDEVLTGRLPEDWH